MANDRRASSNMMTKRDRANHPLHKIKLEEGQYSYIIQSNNLIAFCGTKNSYITEMEYMSFRSQRLLRSYSIS